MSPDEIARRRDEILLHRGPWLADNLRLAKNVFTIGEGMPGSAARVRRAVQTIQDLAGSRIKGRRVLDLACGEGGLALELGQQGAEVVAIERRAALAEKAEFAREALGLRAVTIVHGDARRLSAEEYGYFDVVLALSILDRLDASAAVDLAMRAGAVCKGFALVEARLAERARASHTSDGVVYRGARRSSTAGGPDFLFTRPSILALLSRAGFTSIVETLAPEAAPDAPTFGAFRGRRVALGTAPQANATLIPSWDESPPAKRKGGVGRLMGRSR